VTSPDIAAVITREKQLLDPRVRAQPEMVADILHADFREHGASGRAWDHVSTVEMLEDDPGLVCEANDFAAEQLADDVILLTYRIDGPRPSLRGSVWCRQPDGAWRLRFHQGTLSSSGS
jgi:ribonuclease HI